MQTVFLALGVFGLAFIGLAIGVILTGKKGELKGSCGGVGSDPECCMTCPEKEQCDDAKAAARGSTDHPLLTQAP